MDCLSCAGGVSALLSGEVGALSQLRPAFNSQLRTGTDQGNPTV